MPMKRSLLALAFLLVTAADVPPPYAPRWNGDSIAKLRAWVSAAPDDALPRPDSTALDRALAAGDPAAIDTAASALALKLAKMHLLGTASAGERTGWRIADSDHSIKVEDQLHVALSAGRIDDFFAGQRPIHPDYAVLREAYRAETDPARRRTLARNMERWRWMPRSIGDDYILVNAPFFEARLWRNGQLAGTWPVIVGKTSTPTPVFSAVVTGVTLNPSWYVPASIVRENGGRFSASRGFVYSGGQWRQKPGPGNALGQMKLVMPNPYNVYMHDTPSKDLFEKEVRAFSHGCIRTGNALGFAATLLEGRKSAEEVAAVVKTRTTVTTDIADPLPIYIAYFTAAPDKDGAVRIQPDIYGRD